MPERTIGGLRCWPRWPRWPMSRAARGSRPRPPRGSSTAAPSRSADGAARAGARGGRGAAVRAQRARPEAGPRPAQRRRRDRARRVRPVLRRDHPGPAAGGHRPRPAGDDLQQLPRPEPRAGVRRAAAGPPGRRRSCWPAPATTTRAFTRRSTRKLRRLPSDRRPGGRHRPARAAPATRSCRTTRSAATWPATQCIASGTPQVGVIAGPRELTTTTDRLAGLRRAAREHGRRAAGPAHRLRRLHPRRRRRGDRRRCWTPTRA